MSIIEKIKQSVQAATGLRVLYQSAEQLNRICDNTEYPAAFFFLLANGGLDSSGGHLRERLNLAVFFVDKSQFDFNAKENEQIIQACKERAYKWLRSLYTSTDLRLLSVNGTERVYDLFDVQLTGFAVNVELEELQGDYTCREDYPANHVRVLIAKDIDDILEILRPNGSTERVVVEVEE